MKKNIKLVLALIVAVIMIAGSFSAVAANPVPNNSASAIIRSDDAYLPVNSSSYDNTLTVTGLDAGDTVKFYQIVKWVGATDDNNVKGWIAVAPFDTVLTKSVLETVLLGEGATDGITAAIAGQLATKANGATAVDASRVTVSGDTASLTTSAADQPGIYMAIITAADPDTMYSPVFVSSDFDATDSSHTQIATSDTSYSDNAAVKKSKTTLDKVATASDDAWDYDYAAGAVAIGDKVSFTVTTAIPGYAAYEHPWFKLSDTLTDLALVGGTIEVSDATGPIDAANYTITPASYDKETSYTIQFTETYLKTIGSPTNITVTYDAIVTTDAPLNVNVEKNEVSTEFANNPSNSSDFSVKKDITKHYTFTIDANTLFGEGWTSGEKGTEIVKIGRNAKGEIVNSETTYSVITSSNYQESPLEGAEFKLYTDAECTKEYIPLKDDGTPGTALQLSSDADGRINIPGLDAGVYYLLETKAPDGFVKSNTPVCIDITAVFEEKSNTEYFKDGAWSFTPDDSAKAYTYKYQELKSYTVKVNGVETATHTFLHDSSWAEMSWTDNGSKELPSSIVNVQGVELPSTGGVGTTIFYIGGSLMVLAAAILLITKRRMGIED